MSESSIVISRSIKIAKAELQFKTSRSGGPGGQNVNKLETRVEVIFNVADSPNIPGHDRQRLLKVLASQLDSNGNLHVAVQDTRSQWKNKQLAIERLQRLLSSAVRVPKKRIATAPSRAAHEVRLHSKHMRSQIKHLRKKIVE